MAVVANADWEVDLLGTVELLHEHLTEVLCQEVFEDLRDGERRRLWTLERLVEFWTAVVLRAPPSLRHALVEAQGGGSLYPSVPASPQAFFARSQGLRWQFFRAVFEAFRDRIVEHEAPAFASVWTDLASRFAAVWIVDGSRLDAVARRLEVLWNDRSVPLPGSLLAFYDLRHGMLGRLVYERDAMRSELQAAIASLPEIAPGTLLLGDRLYGVPRFFEACAEHGIHAMTRRNKVSRMTLENRIARREHDDGVLEDWKVTLGVEARLPLRLVRWTRGKEVREILTNVLDPETLAAEEMIDLYPERWKVERLFFDLKEVLNLHGFYAANSNAVAMQVYACAIVHTAMRAAQARIAGEVGVEPEDLSPQKLFPKIAAASSCLSTAEITFEATRRANPGVRLSKPDWHDMPFAKVPLRSILREERRGRRRKRRYCDSRRKCRSLPRTRKIRASRRGRQS